MAAETESGKKKLKKSAAKPDADGAPDGKRKRDHDAEVTPATEAAQQAAPAAAEGSAAAPARKKQRRHKRGEQQEPLDPAEAARRQRQRELQERATQLRQEGKQYVPAKKAGKKPAKEGGQGQDGKGKGGQQKDGDHKGRHYLGDKQPGWRPFNSVEVIVLPIFWNNNKEEKSAVLAAAERARDVLASAGLSADMDASNKYTPGQKMKYWETMGVRVRVELGPRDVANGNCVVAISTKAPGEVASKSVVNMRHKMLDAVRAALQKARSITEQQEEEPQGQSQEQAEGEEKEQQHGTGKAGKAAQRRSEDEEDEDEEEGGGQGASEEDEDEEGTVAAAVAAAKSRKGGVLNKTANAEGRKLKKQRGADAGASGQAAEAADEAAEQPAGAGAAGKGGAVPASADALEDDFGDIVEFEAEEDKLTLSKVERLKKATKQAKAKRKAERFASRGPGGAEEEADGAEEQEQRKGGKAGARKAKVVTF